MCWDPDSLYRDADEAYGESHESFGGAPPPQLQQMRRN